MDTSSLEPIDQLEPGQRDTSSMELIDQSQTKDASHSMTMHEDTSSMELIDYPPTSATSTMPPGSTLVEEENTMITTTASIDNVSFFLSFLISCIL